MAFVVPTTVTQVNEVAKVAVYSSGYTEEQEENIKKLRLGIDRRDLSIEPVTLEEFRDIIVPWFRIHRTEEFRLHPEKVKVVRVPKEPKVKTPKEKKLTKAQTQAKFQMLVMRAALGQPMTEEEEAFYKQAIGG